MISIRWPRLRGRGGTRVLPLLLLGWLALGVPMPAAAQLEQELTQREADYNSALADYNAARAALESQRVRFEALQDSITRARSSGSNERIELAFQRAMPAATELQRLNARVGQTRGVFEAAKRALENILDRRIGALDDQLSRTSIPAERQRLSSLIRDNDAQLRALSELQITNPLRPELAFVPALGVNLDPRMGRQGILGVVQLLERRISEVDEALTGVDDQVRILRRRQQLERQAGDRATSLTRFGASDPVGAARAREAGAEAGPSLTVEEELRRLSDLKAVLELMRHQLDSRARDIRTLAAAGEL